MTCTLPVIRTWHIDKQNYFTWPFLLGKTLSSEAFSSQQDVTCRV